MVSCVFTCTDDLNAEFPAVAARSIGLNDVPLLCSREIPVPGSMQSVIRVLLHYYAATGPRAGAHLPRRGPGPPLGPPRGAVIEGGRRGLRPFFLRILEGRRALAVRPSVSLWSRWRGVPAEAG